MICISPYLCINDKTGGNEREKVKIKTKIMIMREREKKNASDFPSFETQASPE